MSYELAARVSLTHGVVAEAEWLDSDHYLTLMVSPKGAEVYRHSYENSTRELFISRDFMQRYVCGPQAAGNLHWELSPQKRYLYFSWFLDDGLRQWTLLDIADAPNFRLKRFTPPPGMRIYKALFSPDDRYAVFVHDSFQGESDVSMLILDMAAGSEVWRLSTYQIDSIRDLWWGGAILDAPRFYAAAMLHDGQFEPHHGLAQFDLTNKELTFTPGSAGVLCGAAALWGQVACYAASDEQAASYLLEAKIPGQTEARLIPLSARPVTIESLPHPGLLLLRNDIDGVSNQLWLVDVFSGDKNLVDADCAGLSVAADGKLLVRGRQRIELRIYEQVAANGARQEDTETAADFDESASVIGGQ